jgi:glycosyltransferase involved in cell wall biosynthesis
MDVLYCLDWFPKLSQSFILNEIYYLRRFGHNVAVFSINEPDESVVHEEVAELDIPVGYADRPNIRSVLRTLATPRLLTPSILRRSLYLASPRDVLSPLYLTEQCLRFVDSLDWTPDIVHSHFARGNKLGATHTASYLGVPCTLTIHAYDLYSPPDPRLLRLVARRVDRLLTISEYNRTQIRERLDVHTPIDVVRVGIRPDKFAPSDGGRPGRLLTVGRLVEKKGIEYAIDAVADVASDHPDLEYHIVGTGEREERLRARIARHGLEDTVSLLGAVSDDRLVTEFDEAETFLLPCVVAADGDRDGIPVVLMEAMATCVPPISTRVSGIPELIDHRESGLLVEQRDVDALSDAIRELLENESLRGRLGETARETVAATHDADETTARLEASFTAAQRAFGGGDG